VALIVFKYFHSALFFGGPFILLINFKYFISSKEIIKTSRSLLSFWSSDYWWWTIVWSNITLILSDLDEIFRRIRDSKKKKKKLFLHLPLCTWYVSCINNLFPLDFMWQYIALYNSTNKTKFNYWFNLPLIIEQLKSRLAKILIFRSVEYLKIQGR
jgi:hypothetical protein